MVVSSSRRQLSLASFYVNLLPRNFEIWPINRRCSKR